jgi:TonB family protein
MPVAQSENRAPEFRSAIVRGVVFVALALVLVSSAGWRTSFAQKTQKPTRPILTTVKPEYPAALQRAQIGGLVRLSATVLPSGTVSKIQIRGGNPILADCAAAAVMKWKYAPASTETVEEISLSFSPH